MTSASMIFQLAVFIVNIFAFLSVAMMAWSAIRDGIGDRHDEIAFRLTLAFTVFNVIAAVLRLFH